MSHISLSNILGAQEMPSWVRKELSFDKTIRQDDRGLKVEQIQEWLCFHNNDTSVDGHFGAATEQALRNFQIEKNIAETGEVNFDTFEELAKPMLVALTPIAPDGKSFNQLLVAYARQHLNEHPVEIGGQNKGPWVRLYMKGNQGRPWAWCAGFVSFLIHQTSMTTATVAPLDYTFSCDLLAEDGKKKDLFVPESKIKSGAIPLDSLFEGSIFLNRRTAFDWDHTGLVTKFHDQVIETIEGNTNDDGDREGYEVCKRTRNYKNRDFIQVLPI